MYRSKHLAGLAWLTLLLTPSWILAEVHTVRMQDNRPEPGEIHIQPGDTVKWVADINNHLHNVVADDGSWSSGEPDWRWEYQRQFDNVGTYSYYCSEHSDPDGDVYLDDNGRVIVEGDEAPTFQINAGISDAWYDPATDGQGFFIIVWEESQYIFLSWFTFDTERPAEDAMAFLGDPGHRWLTAQGPYQDDTVKLDIYMTSGGVFDFNDPVAGTQKMDGLIDIQWTDCGNGQLSYQIPSLGLAGDIPIQRIVEDNVAACQAAQPAPN